MTYKEVKAKFKEEIVPLLGDAYNGIGYGEGQDHILLWLKYRHPATPDFYMDIPIKVEIEPGDWVAQQNTPL